MQTRASRCAARNRSRRVPQPRERAARNLSPPTPRAQRPWRRRPVPDRSPEPARVRAQRVQQEHRKAMSPRPAKHSPVRRPHQGATRLRAAATARFARGGASRSSARTPGQRPQHALHAAAALDQGKRCFVIVRASVIGKDARDATCATGWRTPAEGLAVSLEHSACDRPGARNRIPAAPRTARAATHRRTHRGSPTGCDSIASVRARASGRGNQTDGRYRAPKSRGRAKHGEPCAGHGQRRSRR